MKEILFGSIAGIITGMGMGGGTILILLLNSFLGIEQKVAQACNLVFFIPTSLISIIINIKNKKIKIKESIFIIIPGIIGSAIGAIIATKIDTNLLKKIFALFLFIIAIYEMIKLKK